MATPQALAALGRVEEAVDLLDANIAARRAWAAASPGDNARQGDLAVAVAVAALGDIHAAACASYAEVHRLHAVRAEWHQLSKLDSGYFAGLIEASERKIGCPAG